MDRNGVTILVGRYHDQSTPNVHPNYSKKINECSVHEAFNHHSPFMKFVLQPFYPIFDGWCSFR